MKRKYIKGLKPCCCFGAFFFGDLFIEDDCPALRLRLETFSVKPPRALLLDTFLTAIRTRPRPWPDGCASSSSSVLLGDSALTGDALRPDLVCIVVVWCCLRRREARNGLRTFTARVPVTKGSTQTPRWGRTGRHAGRLEARWRRAPR
jgi:hypothetical protein